MRSGSRIRLAVHKVLYPQGLYPTEWVEDNSSSYLAAYVIPGPAASAFLSSGDDLVRTKYLGRQVTYVVHNAPRGLR